MKKQNYLSAFKEILESPLHLAFLSIYPILFLYSFNTNNLPFTVIFFPIAVALLFTGLLYLFFLFLLRDNLRAGIGSLISLVIIINHGYFHKAFEKFNIDTSLFNNRIDTLLFILWIIIILLCLHLLLVVKLNLKKITQVLNVFTFVLVMVPLVTILPSVFRPNITLLNDNSKIKEVLAGSLADKNKQPDIYYFIFDRYAGEETLKNIYNYDNSSFYNFLVDQGFYVAAKSRTNYPKTLQSLDSSLNLDYLKSVSDQDLKGNGPSEIPGQKLISDNLVEKYLRSRGYKYYNLGSWWPTTRYNPNADINYISRDLGLNIEEFHRFIIRDTIFKPIIAIFSPRAAKYIDHYYTHRGTILYQFSIFDEIVKRPSPKFIFSHILMPHDPYVFGKDCNFLKEDYPKDPKIKAEKYKNQLTCANTKIKVLVQTLLNKSKTKPIIIFQADEGPHPILNERGPNWSGASTLALAEKFNILNAYFFPDHDYSALYQTITPVNSFRVVFNKYFDTKFGLLPDLSYIFPDENHFYQFKDVTDRLDQQGLLFSREN